MRDLFGILLTKLQKNKMSSFLIFVLIIVCVLVLNNCAPAPIEQYAAAEVQLSGVVDGLEQLSIYVAKADCGVSDEHKKYIIAELQRLKTDTSAALVFFQELKRRLYKREMSAVAKAILLQLISESVVAAGLSQ